MKKILLLWSFSVLLNLKLTESSWKYGAHNGIFAWKQLEYEFNSIIYHNSSDVEYTPHSITFQQVLEDSEKFFIQPNNVPIGLEVYGDRVFITVPRRRYGIPSTLNYVTIPSKAGRTFSRPSAPVLKPYPDEERSKHLVSVYRPRVDACARLWMVDTGHLEVPGVRKQLQPPAIIIYDLKTNREILRQDLDPSVILNERTTAGLTSITVDVDPKACEKAFAYINDLATEGLIVFSLETRQSWRLEHASLRHEEQAMNFTATGHVLNWKDGLFSIALSEADKEGRRTAYYHAMVATHEYSIDTAVLKNKKLNFSEHVKLVGDRGNLSQSGSHAFHHTSGVLFFGNLPQDGIACWNVGNPMTPENYVMVKRDPKELGYISDLKIAGDYVWVLVNGIPKFVYNTQDVNEINYYVRRYSIQELIEGTVCDAKMLYPLLK